jgi:hypothetical protein
MLGEPIAGGVLERIYLWWTVHENKLLVVFWKEQISLLMLINIS